MERKRALALAMAAALAIAPACAERLPPPAEPGPVGERTGDFIPGDLDAAVRVDLDGAKRLFGASVVEAIVLDVVDPAEDPATAELLSKALRGGSTMVLAFRPGLPARSTDQVVIFHGRFDGVDPRSSPKSDWRPPFDLGAGFQLYERPAPRRRSAPARIYSHPSDWLVFVSSAEVDSAERTIDQRAADKHVEPPEKGVVSYAFRADPVVPLLAPKFHAVADTLEGATEVSGSVAADDRGLRATLEVVFTNEADALEAKKRAAMLVTVLRASGRLLGVLAEGAQASAVGSTMVIQIVLDARGLATVLDCVVSGKGC